MTRLGRFASRSAAGRAAGFFAIWAVLSGELTAAVVPGVFAALAAAWTSLYLLPPGRRRIEPFALCAFAVRFLWQSLLAGADVARRALDPALPLRPGFVSYPAGLPAGGARNLFASVTSLLPGTVPTGPGAGGTLLIHCLDTAQPVAAQLAVEEARFCRVIGRNPGVG